MNQAILTIALIQEDLREIAQHLHTHAPTPETADHLQSLAFAARAVRQWVTGQPAPSKVVVKLSAPADFFNRPSLHKLYESPSNFAPNVPNRQRDRRTPRHHKKSGRSSGIPNGLD